MIFKKNLHPIYRFYNEQDERHPGILIWSLKHLYPLLVPREVDPATVRPLDLPLVQSNFYFVKIFNLNDEQDVRYYRWVMDRISNGWFILTYRREMDDKVKLEWIQPYYQLVEIKIEHIEEQKRQESSQSNSIPLLFDYQRYLEDFAGI